MKYRILLVILFISQLTYAQSIVTLISKSNDLFDLMNQGKFEEAQGFFDPSIRDKVTIDNLKKFWVSVIENLGEFQSINNAQSRSQSEYFLVSVDCKFSKGQESFMLTYNKSEKLVGFIIIPKNPQSAYVDPVYSDSTQYKEEFISIKTPGHDLAGMLTTPKTGTNFPVVVLVHGSGALDMDETVGPNKPFRDIALGLAAKGIATIRYVKRTRVYPNEFNKAFTVKEEVIDDALAAIAYAKTVPSVDKKQIYLFGHSLGGMLAPKLALAVPDLNGVILAAAPARKITDLLLEQNRYMYQYSKDTTVAGKKDFETTNTELEKTRLLKLGAIKPDSVMFGAPASYWIDLNNYDQLGTVKRLKNRILVLQGANDFQVSVEDFNMWKAALATNKGAAFKLYPDLNHLFVGQTEKGNGAQYQKAGNVAAYFISDIATWIKPK